MQPRAAQLRARRGCPARKNKSYILIWEQFVVDLNQK